MKIRNLLVVAITMALYTLCAAAQETKGSRTFTDQSNQSVTISRFGTVLSFRNSAGKKLVTKNSYRLCLCGENGPCLDSASTPGEEIKSELKVELPNQGTKLKQGQNLIVTATFRQQELTMMRRLTWIGGSSSVTVDETISATKPICVCSFEATAWTMMQKMCPGPPGLLCPPASAFQPGWVSQILLSSFINFS